MASVGGSCDYDAKANPLQAERRKLLFQTAEHAEPIDMQLVGPSLRRNFMDSQFILICASVCLHVARTGDSGL